MGESVVLSKYQHVCIVKWNHRFLLLEQLDNIVLASLFPMLCEATVKILDLLMAITFTKT